MKFVDKKLAIKLKEKGFDKPCFGYYYIETPTGMTEGELVLNRYPCRGGTYEEIGNHRCHDRGSGDSESTAFPVEGHQPRRYGIL